MSDSIDTFAKNTNDTNNSITVDKTQDKHDHSRMNIHPGVFFTWAAVLIAVTIVSSSIRSWHLNDRDRYEQVFLNRIGPSTSSSDRAIIAAEAQRASRELHAQAIIYATVVMGLAATIGSVLFVIGIVFAIKRSAAKGEVNRHEIAIITNNQKDKIVSLINQHRLVLYNKKSSSVYTDEYGYVNTDKWKEEKLAFIRNVISREMIGRMLVSENDILLLIDNVLDNSR